MLLYYLNTPCAAAGGVQHLILCLIGLNAVLNASNLWRTNYDNNLSWKLSWFIQITVKLALVWANLKQSPYFVDNHISTHISYISWFIFQDSGVGAGIDSYYEYCLKAFILLGEEVYLQRFNQVCMQSVIQICFLCVQLSGIT